MRQPTPEHLSWFPLKYRVVRGMVTAILPDAQYGEWLVLCGPDPYEASRSLATYWTDTGVEKVEIPCVCGARKVGTPDFSRGHSSWCLHTPQKVA